MRKARGMLVLALALVCATSVGANYEAGQRAWEAGQPDVAVAEWRAGADAGETKSMLALGGLYLRGLGVPQNYVQAHMWFNLAASRGDVEALAERDALAAKMTPDALAEAQRLALAHDKLQSYQYAFVMPGMVRPPCFDSALPGYAQHKRLPVRPERSGAKSKGLSGDGASGFWLSPA